MAKFLIKLLVSLLIFGLLLFKAGPAETFASLGRYKIVALLIINFTTVSGFLLGGTGVILLGRAINAKLPFLGAIKGFLASISLALFVPGRAGDLTLPFFWKRFIQTGESLSVVFIDKSVTMLWVFIIGSMGVFSVFNTRIGFVFAGAGMGAIIAVYLLIGLPKTRAFVSSLLPKKILDFLQGSMNAFRTIGKKGKTTLAVVLCLTWVRIMIYGFGFWISLWGLDAAPPVIYAILVMAMAQFLAIIPISVLGVGPVDAICVYALHLVNVDTSLVMAALIAGRAITLFWLALFFVCFNLGGGQGNEAGQDSAHE